MSVATSLSNLISNLKLFLTTIPATWKIIKELNNYYRASENKGGPVQITVGASQTDRPITWYIQLSSHQILSTEPQPQQTVTTGHTLQKPAFGFMKNTGSIHGDILSPVVPENTWDVLQ